VFPHRFLKESIQRTTGARVFLHLLIPNLILPFVEPLLQFPELLARKFIDGGLDVRQSIHNWSIGIPPQT
jgi:hypothetical protein